jgi:hypothetical protein
MIRDMSEEDAMHALALFLLVLLWLAAVMGCLFLAWEKWEDYQWEKYQPSKERESVDRFLGFLRRVRQQLEEKGKQ